MVIGNVCDHISQYQANEALECLQSDDSESSTYSKVVALRSKGLILRDVNHTHGGPHAAITCHKEALELLKPLGGAQRAQIETALNLAE